MKVLDLFSGTGSVKKATETLPVSWCCVSFDLAGADINCDILEWDYKSAFSNHLNQCYVTKSAAVTTGIDGGS